MTRKPDLPHVQTITKNGRVYHYWRGSGRRVRLPDDPSSPEFLRAYLAAREGHEPRAVSDTSISAMIDSYLASDDWRRLKPSTQKTNGSRLEQIRAVLGPYDVRDVKRSHVKTWLAQKATNGTGAANNFLRSLRIVMKTAIELELRVDDPTQGVRPYKPGQGVVAWSDADVARYEARWPVGTPQRLAFALLLYTAQRRSDVVRMGWQHVDGEMIAVVQQKTGARLSIPMHPDLVSILHDAPRDRLTFVATQYGKPFTAAGFGNRFREWCDAAGLTERSAHGLRKAAATRLAEAGCTTHEIAAITGHKTLAEVEHYTRSADQKRVAKVALLKLAEQEQNTKM